MWKSLATNRNRTWPVEDTRTCWNSCAYRRGFFATVFDVVEPTERKRPSADHCLRTCVLGPIGKPPADLTFTRLSVLNTHILNRRVRTGERQAFGRTIVRLGTGSSADTHTRLYANAHRGVLISDPRRYRRRPGENEFPVSCPADEENNVPPRHVFEKCRGFLSLANIATLGRPSLFRRLFVAYRHAVSVWELDTVVFVFVSHTHAVSLNASNCRRSDNVDPGKTNLKNSIWSVKNKTKKNARQRDADAGKTWFFASRTRSLLDEVVEVSGSDLNVRSVGKPAFPANNIVWQSFRGKYWTKRSFAAYRFSRTARVSLSRNAVWEKRVCVPRACCVRAACARRRTDGRAGTLTATRTRDVWRESRRRRRRLEGVFIDQGAAAVLERVQCVVRRRAAPCAPRVFVKARVRASVLVC